MTVSTPFRISRLDWPRVVWAGCAAGALILAGFILLRRILVTGSHAPGWGAWTLCQFVTLVLAVGLRVSFRGFWRGWPPLWKTSARVACLLPVCVWGLVLARWSMRGSYGPAFSTLGVALWWLALGVALARDWKARTWTRFRSAAREFWASVFLIPQPAEPASPDRSPALSITPAQPALNAVTDVVPVLGVYDEPPEQDVAEDCGEDDREESCGFSPDTISQFERRRSDTGGEQVTGTLRVQFADQERSTCVHIAFCPALPNLPDVQAYWLSAAEGELAAESADEDVAIQVAALTPFGMRLELKRAAADAQSLSGLVSFEAHCRPAAEPE